MGATCLSRVSGVRHSARRLSFTVVFRLVRALGRSSRAHRACHRLDGTHQADVSSSGPISCCCLSDSAFWYAFQPGHHFVCHLQILAMSESGLRSAYDLNRHVSQELGFVFSGRSAVTSYFPRLLKTHAPAPSSWLSPPAPAFQESGQNGPCRRHDPHRR